MIRALLEGCAHEMRMVVDAFQSDIKGGITDLRLTGGGTKSDGFAQIMTDIIGQPTKVTRERECTVFGAAILGAFGSGAFSSIDEAVEAMVNVEGEFEPEPVHQGSVRRGERHLPRPVRGDRQRRAVPEAERVLDALLLTGKGRPGGPS